MKKRNGLFIEKIPPETEMRGLSVNDILQEFEGPEDELL